MLNEVKEVKERLNETKEKFNRYHIPHEIVGKDYKIIYYTDEKGNIDGLWKKYWKDTRYESINYSAGKKNGGSFILDSKGRTIMIENYKDNLLHGTKYTYYDSGQTEKCEYYHEGRLHDLRTEYYRTGVMKIKEYYNNGLLHGEKQQFDPDGHMTSTEIYDNGIIVDNPRRWWCLIL